MPLSNDYLAGEITLLISMLGTTLNRVYSRLGDDVDPAVLRALDNAIDY